MKSKYLSYGGYGVDVASRRADDLDKLAIEQIASQSHSTILDLGSGMFGQSIRLAQAGAGVTAVDKDDFQKVLQQVKKENNLAVDQLDFIQVDLRDLTQRLADKKFDHAYCQRTLHYLKYSEANELLSFLRQIIHGRLYISVSGLDSEIGDKYPDKEKSVENRFAKLCEADQEKFFINEEICLFRQAEFENLLERSGWLVERCWLSAFGNIKAVCV